MGRHYHQADPRTDKPNLSFSAWFPTTLTFRQKSGKQMANKTFLFVPPTSA